jgi:hypothetical protein
MQGVDKQDVNAVVFALARQVADENMRLFESLNR